METLNLILGIGMGFIAFYLPLILHAVFVVALGVLFAKVRSIATGMLFIGFLFSMSAPLIVHFLFGSSGVHLNFYVSFFNSFCVLIQTIGLVLYVCTVSRPTNA